MSSIVEEERVELERASVASWLSSDDQSSQQANSAADLPVAASAFTWSQADNWRPAEVIFHTAAAGPLIDIRRAALSFAAERNFIRGLFRFLFTLVYFIAYITILLFQLDVASAFDISETLEVALIRNKVESATSFDAMYQWLTNVWAPVHFGSRTDGTNGTYSVTGQPLLRATEYSFAGRLKLAKAPSIEQFRFRATPCHGWRTSMVCVVKWGENAFGPDGNPTLFKPHPLENRRFEVLFRINADSPLPHSSPTMTSNYYNVTSLDDAVDALLDLRNMSFVDDLTAFIRVQSMWYHPSYRMLATVRVVFVQTVAGVLVPYASTQTDMSGYHKGSDIQVLRLSSYENVSDYIRAFFEALFGLLTLGTTVLEARSVLQAKRDGGNWLAYFTIHTSTGRKNIFNLLFLVGVYFSMATYFTFLFSYNTSRLDDSLVLPQAWDTTSRSIYFVASTILLVAFTYRMLMTIGFNSQWRFLSSTLERAASELVHFSFLFVMLLLGYALAGHYYFGHSIGGFRTVLQSLQTVLTILVAQTPVTFDVLVAAGSDISYQLVPSVYYWSFIFVVFFIMINMFLAIVMRAYEAATDELRRGHTFQRGLTKKLREPFQGFMLDLFQEMQWIDFVLYNYPVGLFCSFQFSANELTLRLRWNTLARGKIASAKYLMVLFPTGWEIDTFKETALWRYNANGADRDAEDSGSEDEGQGSKPELTVPPPILLEYPCHMAPTDRSPNSSDLLILHVPPGFEQVDPEVVIGLRLTGHATFLSGPVNVCATRTGNVAAYVGGHFSRRLPFVVKRLSVTKRQLHYAPVDAELTKPARPRWRQIVRHCERHFQPTILDSEDEGEWAEYE